MWRVCHGKHKTVSNTGQEKNVKVKWNLLEPNATIRPLPSFYGRPLFQPPENENKHIAARFFLTLLSNILGFFFSGIL